jgi:ferredoxin
MNAETEGNIHFVCTHDEGWQIVEKNQRYWLSNCGCREQRGECKHLRMDVCLFFQRDFSGSGSAMHEVDVEEIKRLFAEAREKHLVVRPFRDDRVRARVAGICFCCDDCCGYFLDPQEKCDKGRYQERTNLGDCTHCGECVQVCYFGARTMIGEELSVAAVKCYGCGLCTDVCPAGCVEMIDRNSFTGKMKKEV